MPQELNQENLKRVISDVYSRLGKTATEEDINKIVGSLIGGIQKTANNIQPTNNTQKTTDKISSSFMANVQDIAQGLGKALGLEETKTELTNIRKQIESLMSPGRLDLEREQLKESLRKEKEAAISREETKADLEKRQLLATLGLSPAVGSGVVELADEFLRRNRESINLLAAQYDKAIAELDFKAAEAARNEMLNLINFQAQIQDVLNRMQSNIMSPAIQIAQLDIQQKQLEAQQKQQEKTQALNDLNNFLNLYSNVPVKKEKLPKDVLSKINELSTKTGIPSKTILDYLEQGGKKQIITYQNPATNEVGAAIFDDRGNLLKTVTIAKGTSGLAGFTTSPAGSFTPDPIVDAWLSGLYINKLPNTDDERAKVFSARQTYSNSLGANYLISFRDYLEQKLKNSLSKNVLSGDFLSGKAGVLSLSDFKEGVKNIILGSEEVQRRFSMPQERLAWSSYYLEKKDKLSVDEMREYVADAITYRIMIDYGKGDPNTFKQFVKEFAIHSGVKPSELGGVEQSYSQALYFLQSRFVLPRVKQLLNDSYLSKLFFAGAEFLPEIIR